MSKIKMTILALGLVISMVGCGSNQDKKDTASETKIEENNTDIKKEENKKENSTDTKKEEAVKNPNTGRVSLESLMAMDPSPKTDFNVQKNPDGGYTVTGYVGKEEMVYVPDEIDGIPVTEISKYTFANDQTPKAVRLGKNVKLIEFGSFANNENLQIFVAGEGLEKIEESSFNSSTNLKVVKLNEGLKEIKDVAFTIASSLKEVEIPSTVEKFGKGIFHMHNEDLVIKGKAGSKAKEIAEDNKAKYEEIK